MKENKYEKISRKVKVKNALGLHARPATAIAKLLQEVKSSVSFTYCKETVNARSIMSILMLAATKNTQIVIDIVGPDAQETMDKLVAAFENKFGE
jgi:phosphocarrier protein HPr